MGDRRDGGGGDGGDGGRGCFGRGYGGGGRRSRSGDRHKVSRGGDRYC